MILVAGPPCGGKTTYVRQHARPGQKVLDYDDIIEGLGGVRYDRDPALHLRAESIWQTQMPSADWVILTAPTRFERGRFRSMHQAQVVVVMAPLEVCLARARAERPASWESAIRKWFARWEPSRSGHERVVITHGNHAGAFSFS